jgi:hypothetical protein
MNERIVLDCEKISRSIQLLLLTPGYEDHISSSPTWKKSDKISDLKVLTVS